jgi:thiamine-monophosphate kinase
MSEESQLGELGESEALAQIIPLLPTAPSVILGPGDDSAILSVPDSRVVISTDMMIEGPDFRWDWSSPEQVGWKAIASNAADIAAMGATPTAFQISVAAPESTRIGVLLGIARGVSDAIAALAPLSGVSGGDLSRAPVVTLSVTVLGDLGGRAPVTRSGAKPGDVLAVAGELGLSHRGLIALQGAGGNPEAIAALKASDAAVAHHLAPRPPIHLGVVANDAGATAMMDISDGLWMDATRMAKSSGVVIELAPDYPWDEASLMGGEDHGLLAAFPATTTVPEGFVVIGSIREASAAPGVHLEGVELGSQPGGWDPFYGASAK